MIITLLLLFILIILLCHYFIHYGKFGRLINQIPGDSSFLLIGNLLKYFNRSPEDILKIHEATCNKYYPILKYWLFNRAHIVIQHPDDVEKILSNTKQHLEKGFMYRLFHPWLGTGLLTSSGAKWHKRRKLLTKAFHFYMLKQFVDVLIEEGNSMTQSLKDMKGLIVEDLVCFISHHTLNAICETAMGISLESMDKFGQSYRQAVHEMGKIIIYRLFRPWYHFDAIFALSRMGRIHAKNLKILHGFAEKIIAERRQYHESTGWEHLMEVENNTLAETNKQETIKIKKKRLAMLDLLIAVSRSNEINDLDIREEVDTFMFEGHDTITMGLCFAMLLLAEHKDIQHRVRSEVSAVMRDNSGELNMTLLHKLPYLERCLKEALRLYPSVPFIFRTISEDVKLQSYLVPPGPVLEIPIKKIHRDPNFWPNPDVFDPDRFLPEKIQNRHPFSYIPFSAGSRNCIGQRFAMLELKAVIAPLIHNFYLEPVDYLKDLRFTMDIVNRVAHPIRIRFVPIDCM